MRFVVAWAIGVAMCASASACSSKAAAPDVVPGAPAGDVTEASGDVRATRDGATRALAIGAVVAGDDVIATGADGRVTIVLRKNRVPWSLGPGQSKKVADSAAWSAVAAASGEVATDDHSLAAGRHAERSATDTGASAAVPPPAIQPIAPPLPPPPPDDRGGLGMHGTGPGGGGTGEGIGLGGVGTIGHGAGGGNGQGYGMGGGSIGGSIGGKSGSAAPKISESVTVHDGGPPVEVARRIVRQNVGRVRLCYEHALARDPSIAGVLTVKLAIATDGSVTSATPLLWLDRELTGCIADGAKGLSFPSSDTPWTLGLTIELAAGG